jgi:hypothetical protein
MGSTRRSFCAAGGLLLAGCASTGRDGALNPLIVS